MSRVSGQTWLEKLEEERKSNRPYWMDPEFIRDMPIRPHDQTSNQLIVDIELGRPSNADLLLQTAKELKHEGWLAVYTRMSVLMSKKNIDYIQGRVLLQTLPSNAYDTEKTLEHARLYDREFARVGISRDRYCIKIPSTGPALNAAKILTDEGIPTLGTAVFGVPQAIACSQAGTLYISPYYNEVRAHETRSIWSDYEDPATQHPMSIRIMQILEVYKKLYKETGKEQPLLKNASFISTKEAMAAGELGCHSATLPNGVLDQLAKLIYSGSQQPGEGVPKPVHVYKFAQPTPKRLRTLTTITSSAAMNLLEEPSSADIDYLANNGAELENAIKEDHFASRRLDDALKIFILGEERSKGKVELAMSKV